jgi:23S rRNA (uracil1939-C5)-methyltransferase
VRAIDPLLLFVQNYAAGGGISVYDEATGRGLLRHVLVRYGSGGDLLLCLVLNGDSLPDNAGFIRALYAAMPDYRGRLCVCINENTADTNVILGRNFCYLTEKEYIEDVLCGLRFRIAAPTFYQVNHGVAELLYEHVCGLAEQICGENPHIVDLFCGVGTIGLCAAARPAGASLLGVEILPEAVELARVNAAVNGVTTAEFLCLNADDRGSIEGQIMSALRSARGEGDLLIVDPPRAGLAGPLIEAIARAGVRNIIYVSCDPGTLMRDLRAFTELGYCLGKLTPFDMFPRTGHVEAVAEVRKC